MKNNASSPTITFYISGIHCGACELLIRDILDEIPYIKKYEFTVADNSVNITFNDKRLADKELAQKVLQKYFVDTVYTFSLEPNKKIAWLDYVIGIAMALGVAILIGLLATQKIIAAPSVNAESSLLAFLAFGFSASISSCAVLVGGIILTVSKSWFASGGKKWLPIVGFQIGRVLAFGVGGFILGLIGSIFHLNTTLTAILLLVVAVVMILTGLDFVGLPAGRQGLKIWSRLPKIKPPVDFSKLTNFTNAAQKPEKRSWVMPSLIGMATFFVPCGFTATAQLMALSSLTPWRAMLIMVCFVLGTVPVLSIIAWSGSLMGGNKKFNQISNVALGTLIILFGLQTLNAQLTILDLPNANGLLANIKSLVLNEEKVEYTATFEENGTQVVKVTANGVYSPTRLRLKADAPTRLEVDAKVVDGCTNAMISSFWEGRLPLKNGEVAIKEFVTPKPGRYKITCWMGMVTISVEVI